MSKRKSMMASSTAAAAVGNCRERERERRNKMVS
jgi:hypothetical protein